MLNSESLISHYELIFIYWGMIGMKTEIVEKWNDDFGEFNNN